ncbi:hypothetical protein OIU74_016095 [Salix koriyanagi]|uniref:Uncharacterized protein n=1 Tax=Salix koriyanagi TaxID=2511006 RepID=A0A9Q0PFK4_9ROSI|nr:hypothetical protein OIU74_016095 [Salix koriyanagi]
MFLQFNPVRGHFFSVVVYFEPIEKKSQRAFKLLEEEEEEEETNVEGTFSAQNEDDKEAKLLDANRAVELLQLSAVVYSKPTEKEAQRAFKQLEEKEKEEETNVEGAFSAKNEDDKDKVIRELKYQLQKAEDENKKLQDENKKNQADYLEIIEALNNQNTQVEQRVKDLEDQLTKITFEMEEKREKADQELSREGLVTQPIKRKKIEEAKGKGRKKRKENKDEDFIQNKIPLLKNDLQAVKLLNKDELILIDKIQQDSDKKG